MIWIGDKEYTHQEYMEMTERERAERWARQRAEAAAEEAERREASRLIRQLGAAYTEYNNFMEARPQLRPQAAGDQSSDQRFYQQLRQNLGHADDAPRCNHIKADGLRCGSPRLKTGELCYAHQRMAECRPQKLRLPAMEDPNSIQLGLMQVARALVDRSISEKTAGLLLYSLQIAAGNVGRLTFHQAPKEMVADQPAPSPAPVKRAEPPGPDLSIYDELDPDLRLRLAEISDEFDRRRAEKHRREETARGAAGEADAKAVEVACKLAELNHDGDKLRLGAESFTTEGAKESSREPKGTEFATAFAGQGEEAINNESPIPKPSPNQHSHLTCVAGEG